jgi:hypothetical protein
VLRHGQLDTRVLAGADPELPRLVGRQEFGMRLLVAAAIVASTPAT